MPVEKRKERRIKVALPIKITHGDNLTVIGKTENISRLGAYLETDKELSVGIDVDISLEIPGYTKNLSLTGKIGCKGNIFRCNLVRESGPKEYYGTGVFFTDFLSSADRDKLSKYIDFLTLKEDKDIKEGIKRWQHKRGITKKTRQAQEIQIKQKDYQTEIMDLLKQILTRLTEISHLLKLQNKT